MSSSYLRSRRLPPPPLLLLFVLAAALLPIISSEYQPIITKCEAAIINNNETLEDFKSVLGSLKRMGYHRVNTMNVYGLSWCRHDMPVDHCDSCLANAAYRIKIECPENVVAARCLYLDYCYIRVEPRNFYGELDTSFSNLHYYTHVSVGYFHRRSYWQNVTQHLKSWLSDEKLHMKRFQAEEFDLPAASVKVHYMFLCATDISPHECGICLSMVYNVMIQECFYRFTFCELIYPSCFMTYWTE